MTAVALVLSVFLFWAVNLINESNAVQCRGAYDFYFVIERYAYFVMKIIMSILTTSTGEAETSHIASFISNVSAGFIK